MKAVLLCLLAVGASATLERIFVLHRGGARTPAALVNNEMTCAHHGACALADHGVAQMTALGHQLQQRYPTILLPAEYDVTKMQSVSTDEKRTVQSAEAVVTGMWQNALPFVDFVPLNQDMQLAAWCSWPAVVLAGGPSRNDTDFATAALQILDRTTIKSIAQELGVDATCDVNLAVCLRYIADTAACQLANGTALGPQLSQFQHEVKRIRALSLSLRNGYYPNRDPLERNAGSFGYPLASAMIAALTYTPAAGFVYNTIHRAGSDATLLAFYAATGVWQPSFESSTEFASGFGEAVIVERLSHENGPDTLKAYRALPTQTYSATYTYDVTFTEIGLKCVSSSSGVSYTNETSDGCTVNQVWAAINSTAGADDSAECYVSDANLRANKCNDRGAPVAGSPCEFFRNTCIDEPCAGNSNWIADPSQGFACVSLSPPDQSDVSGVAFAITGLASAVVGIVVGAAAMLLGRKRVYS
jgi:hypothetical protein